MKFCKVCERILIRSIAGQSLIYSCPDCNLQELADDNDHIILDGASGTSDNSRMFSRLIACAAHDPACDKKPVKCDKCNMPYMSFVRLPDTEQVIYVCKCGNQVTG